MSKYLQLFRPILRQRQRMLIGGDRRLNAATSMPDVQLSRSRPSVASNKFNLHSINDNYFVGRKLHGFTVEKVDQVPELCLATIRLTHDVSGASYLHIARDDQNNVFCVGLRTTPTDDTGVPHVLEHTALCGSVQYPCRDPFFKMLNRSLSTFMNAFTASDYTMYPFATQNAKDFENLLNVYLDAVFRPLLRELDFLQEGWRLEHSDISDSESPIVLKGVVFNEMKGAFANSERLFAQHLQSALLPGHTYSHISGGDPVHIPSLTWQQLRDFHKTHYQPSNAWFFTYGDFPLDGHLKLIDASLQRLNVESEHETCTIDTSVPDEIRWNNPREMKVTCRPDQLVANPDKQTTVAVGYLTNKITDSFESLTLYVLSELLVGGPNAPFYKALLEPNIGSSYSPATGYNNQTKEAIFSVGLQGIHEDDVTKVTTIIDETLDEIIRDGFSEEQIEAVLHGIELSLKHQSANFGIHLIMMMSAPWNHGVEPVDTLRFNALVHEFRERLSRNPRFLQDKVKQYLKYNPHHLKLVMSPDVDFEAKSKIAEDRVLNNKLLELNDLDLKRIYDQGLQLAAKQDEIEDVSSLPTLRVSDIEPGVQRTILEHTHIGNIPVQLSSQPTNGLIYFRGVIDCRQTLPDHLRPTLPLFCNVLTRMGAGNLDYRQMAQQIELKTGGLSVTPLLVQHPVDNARYDEGIALYSHCLERNAAEMWKLWTEIFNGAELSEIDRLRTLVAESASDLAASLPDSGHVYAMTKSASTLNPLGALKETFQGLEQIKIVKSFAEVKSSDKLDHLIENLKMTAKILLTKDHLRLSVNCTADYMPTACGRLQEFVSSIPITPTTNKNSKPYILNNVSVGEFVAHSCRQHIVLPLPVNFVGRSLPAVHFNDVDFAPLRVLSRLMTTKFLHREIREKGGAYGGGATCNPSGNFTFYSYRDPRNVKTLQTFDESVEWALRADFTDRDIDEAKLSIFSEVDKPVAPADKGVSQFLHSITDDLKQTHRERLVQTSRDDLLRVTHRYLDVDKGSSCGDVILGPEIESTDENSSDFANNNKRQWTIIKDYQ